MSMPIDFVEVRHGQSEANLYQHARRIDPEALPPDGFQQRHDSLMRLSPLGRDQAVTAGWWIAQEFPGGFDGLYVSPHVRAIETAGHIATAAALGGKWDLDDRVRERDWGEVGSISLAEHRAYYPRSAELKSQSQWYWCPPGGESLGTGVRMRFEDFLETMHRERSGERVLVVTHGEYMDVSRVVLERTLPWIWEEQQKRKSHQLANCMVLHWSRRNPLTGEISKRIEWRRAICPWDPAKSWDEGEWVHLGPRRRYSPQEMLAMVEAYPRLYPEADES